MIFRKSKKTVKKGMWWMDKIVTGIIVWWAAASIFGLSRTKKWKRFWSKAADSTGKYSKKWVTIFGKVTVKLISLFQKK
jgi:hypothetical protein